MIKKSPVSPGFFIAVSVPGCISQSDQEGHWLSRFKNCQGPFQSRHSLPSIYLVSTEKLVCGEKSEVSEVHIGQYLI